MTDLLPCPFCGAKASICTGKGESLWSHDIVTWTKVSCPECDCETKATCPGYEPSAVAAWNKRSERLLLGSLKAVFSMLDATTLREIFGSDWVTQAEAAIAKATQSRDDKTHE